MTSSVNALNSAVSKQITNGVGASGTASGTGALSKLSGNLDSFLKILTAQLKNQNPLEPLKTEDFTNQLVLYTQAEQQINTNSKLDQLISQNNNKVTSDLIGYVGKNIEVKGDQFFYRQGETNQILYTLPENAKSATIAFYDSTGKLVSSFDADKTQGEHAFTFSGGRGPDGKILGNGVYKVRVTAPNSTGKSNLTVAYSTIGRVDGTLRDSKTNAELLTVGDLQVAASNVVGVIGEGVVLGGINPNNINYIGKYVQVKDDLFFYNSGSPTLASYDLPSNYSGIANAAISVFNLDGTLAFSRAATGTDLTSGTHTFTIPANLALSDGTYRVALTRPNTASTTLSSSTLPPINIGINYTTNGKVSSIDTRGVNIGTYATTTDKILRVF